MHPDGLQRRRVVAADGEANADPLVIRFDQRPCLPVDLSSLSDRMRVHDTDGAGRSKGGDRVGERPPVEGYVHLREIPR